MIEEQLKPEERALLRKKYRVRQTIVSMMNQRGYKDPNKFLGEGETFEEFIDKYRNKGGMSETICIKEDNSDDRIIVFFEFEVTKLEKQLVLLKLQRMHSSQVQNMIIIINGDPANSKVIDKNSKQYIDQINQADNYSCQVFNMEELIYDITQHELVPRHIKISPEEKEKLLEKYRISPNQLPRIQSSDPVAKFLGLKKNDVVKIIRKSETAGVYVTYRITV